MCVCVCVYVYVCLVRVVFHYIGDRIYIEGRSILPSETHVEDQPVKACTAVGG